MNKDKSISLKTAIFVAGAFVSYTVGAGFASGNEVFQFFGSWGFPESFLAIGGAALVTLIYCVCLYKTGQHVSFERTSDAYNYFGGKALGWFIALFVFIFVFGSFMLMFTGAGSLLNQFWGLPQWVGAIVLAVITGVIVLGGLKTVERVLGSAGIIILAYVLIFGIVSLLHPDTSFDQAANAQQMVAEGKIWQANLFELPPLGWIPGLASYNSPLITGVLYGALCVVSGFPFYMTLGKRMKSPKDATVSAIVTTLAFYGCVGFVLIILLSNFQHLVNPVTGTMHPFPTLAGVSAIWPSGGWTYVIIIFGGIFTSAAGYLWVLSDWFLPGQERTRKTNIFILVLLIFGASLGGVIPFSALINFLFPLTGVAGLIITASLVVKVIKGFDEPVSREKVKEVSEEKK